MTPHQVHHNMLRGNLATLTWDQCKHLHKEDAAQDVSEAVAKQRFDEARSRGGEG